MVHHLFKTARTLDYWSPHYKCPEIYKDFFFRWSIFNTVYNDIVPNEKKDWEKIKTIGENYKDLWLYIDELGKKLVATECVGSKRGLESPPREWVKSATIYLRNCLGMDHNAICNNCKKVEQCQNVSDNVQFTTPLQALLTIIYQIRNNLVHGDKNEPDDEAESERNQELAQTGSEILGNLLDGMRNKLRKYLNNQPHRSP